MTDPTAPARTPPLEVRGLSKTYRVGFRRLRRPALRDLSFTVAAGEVFGYLGPNGSGKTTTLKILVGVVFPDAGDAHILGEPLGSRRGRERLGYLPENPYLYRGGSAAASSWSA
jgi:ABC-2 type transport system ATP-binding protein